jgi:hypothetical protein
MNLQSRGRSFMDDGFRYLPKKVDGIPDGVLPGESDVKLKVLRKVLKPEEAKMAFRPRKGIPRSFFL